MNGRMGATGYRPEPIGHEKHPQFFQREPVFGWSCARSLIDFSSVPPAVSVGNQGNYAVGRTTQKIKSLRAVKLALFLSEFHTVDMGAQRVCVLLFLLMSPTIESSVIARVVTNRRQSKKGESGEPLHDNTARHVPWAGGRRSYFVTPYLIIDYSRRRQNQK